MVLAPDQRLVKREERRRAESDGNPSDASWTEEERPESAQQPVAPPQVRRPLASTAQHDQLLLEQEILRDHRSHATGATELGGLDGQVQQGEQDIPHARVSVGRTPAAAQRCSILDSAGELAIRDPQVGSVASGSRSRHLFSASLIATICATAGPAILSNAFSTSEH